MLWYNLYFSKSLRKPYQYMFFSFNFRMFLNVYLSCTLFINYCSSWPPLHPFPSSPDDNTSHEAQCALDLDRLRWTATTSTQWLNPPIVSSAGSGEKASALQARGILMFHSPHCNTTAHYGNAVPQLHQHINLSSNVWDKEKCSSLTNTELRKRSAGCCIPHSCVWWFEHYADVYGIKNK